MCEPVLILAGAGMAMTAIGQYQQGQSAAAAAEYNAQMGELQARDLEAQARDEKEQLGLLYARERASGRADTAASGVRVGTGSSLDWENDLLENYILDRAQIDMNTARGVSGIRNQGVLDRAQGRASKRAGAMGAGGSLLSGAGTVSNMWYERNNPGVR
jgi:hypothetical protein